MFSCIILWSQIEMIKHTNDFRGLVSILGCFQVSLLCVTYFIMAFGLVLNIGELGIHVFWHYNVIFVPLKGLWYLKSSSSREHSKSRQLPKELDLVKPKESFIFSSDSAGRLCLWRGCLTLKYGRWYTIKVSPSQCSTLDWECSPVGQHLLTMWDAPVDSTISVLVHFF